MVRTEGYLYVVRSRQQAVLITNMCGRHGKAVSAEEDNLYRVLPETFLPAAFELNNTSLCTCVQLLSDTSNLGRDGTLH